MGGAESTENTPHPTTGGKGPMVQVCVIKGVQKHVFFVFSITCADKLGVASNSISTISHCPISLSPPTLFFPVECLSTWSIGEKPFRWYQHAGSGALFFLHNFSVPSWVPMFVFLPRVFNVRGLACIHTRFFFLCQVPGMGVYHSGVVINGREYTFGGGGGGGSGVVEHKPGSAYGRSDGQWQFYKTVDLGKSSLNSNEISSALGQLRGMFPSNTYHLTGKNCNHFCEMFCIKLGVTYPSWVNRAAKLANTMQGVPDFVGQQKKLLEAEEKKRKVVREKQDMLKSRQTKLKPEPAQGTAGVVLIQVNCPTGKKAKRRFLSSDTIAEVMEFVYAFDSSVSRTGFELIETMPRKVYSNQSQTLKSAGLVGRANLYVKKKM